MNELHAGRTTQLLVFIAASAMFVLRPGVADQSNRLPFMLEVVSQNHKSQWPLCEMSKWEPIRLRVTFQGCNWPDDTHAAETGNSSHPSQLQIVAKPLSQGRSEPIPLILHQVGISQTLPSNSCSIDLFGWIPVADEKKIDQRIDEVLAKFDANSGLPNQKQRNDIVEALKNVYCENRSGLFELKARILSKDVSVEVSTRESLPQFVRINSTKSFRKHIEEKIHNLHLAAAGFQPPTVDTSDSRQTEQQLEGTWKLISVEFEGKSIPVTVDTFITISKNRGTVRSNSNQFQTSMAFDLEQLLVDSTTSFGSKTISSKGIYRVGGDTLTLISTSASGAPRPTEFRTRAGDRRTFCVYQRIKENP